MRIPLKSGADEIHARFGLVERAGIGCKGVRIFGINTAVSTTEETIWAAGGLYSGFLTTAATLRIRSGGNAADDAAGSGARSVRITYLDENLDLQVETVATAGASQSLATSGTARRLVSADVETCGTYGGSNTGTINIETATGVLVAGMPAGASMTQIALYTVPAGRVAYLTRVRPQRSSTNDCTIIGYYRSGVDVVAAPFEPAVEFVRWPELDYRTEAMFTLEAGLPFPEKTDIWFNGFAASGNAQVSVAAEFLEMAP